MAADIHGAWQAGAHSHCRMSAGDCVVVPLATPQRGGIPPPAMQRCQCAIVRWSCCAPLAAGSTFGASCRQVVSVREKLECHDNQRIPNPPTVRYTHTSTRRAVSHASSSIHHSPFTMHPGAFTMHPGATGQPESHRGARLLVRRAAACGESPAAAREACTSPVPHLLVWIGAPAASDGRLWFCVECHPGGCVGDWQRRHCVLPAEL